MASMKPLFLRILALVLVGLLSGCMGFYGHRRYERSSSIADFLFPKEQRVVSPEMPVLRLPLKVGIAFVPSANRHGGDFSDYQQQQLLEKVADSFRSQRFVESVQVVPTTYLRREGSFDNLDQLKRMMGLDVIVLLAYDQIQFTSDNLLSLSYWTIIGAYTVHGNKNDTHTMIEAVVYDIGSRSLLFRAPGANQTRRGSTAFELGENRRRDSAKSLELASADLTINLNAELSRFMTRVKEGKSNVKVEHREGYTGGGSADALLIIGLVLAAGVALGRKHLKH